MQSFAIICILNTDKYTEQDMDEILGNIYEHIHNEMDECIFYPIKSQTDQDLQDEMINKFHHNRDDNMLLLTAFKLNQTEQPNFQNPDKYQILLINKNKDKRNGTN